jgi:hypothetical protein
MHQRSLMCFVVADGSVHMQGSMVCVNRPGHRRVSVGVARLIVPVPPFSPLPSDALHPGPASAFS